MFADVLMPNIIVADKDFTPREPKEKCEVVVATLNTCMNKIQHYQSAGRKATCE